MSPWASWTAEAFARAKAQGKPILAVAGRLPPPSLAASEGEIAESFVAVLADPETRPDAAARIGAGTAVVLDAAGARRASLDLSAEPGSKLAGLARQASAPAETAADGPVWTGAVTDAKKPAAGPSSEEAAAALTGLPPEPRPAAVEALLHAAGERGDAAARSALDAALDAALALREPAKRSFLGDGSPLAVNARWAILFWDAHALTGDARHKDAAGEATAYLLGSLFDPSEGAFRRAPGESVYPADGNAQAAVALLRAQAFGAAGASEAAGKTLGYLQGRLYDPLLGLLHARGGEGESVVGLLGDAAWTALAFTDAFLATGVKAHREFADGMLRFLFQELWERDGGGFLDRVARADDPAILREPRLDPELNALALEVCRRMHHLKGNHNYRRWLEWGLTGAWRAKGADRGAALARVADLHARGRMDFELVGRPGEPKADALLAAAHRLYLPRKVISFVDPDDQDYILAHRLEAETYPRLFACAADLRPVADAAEPAAVPAIADALRKAP